MSGNLGLLQMLDEWFLFNSWASMAAVDVAWERFLYTPDALVTAARYNCSEFAKYWLKRPFTVSRVFANQDFENVVACTIVLNESLDFLCCLAENGFPKRCLSRVYVHACNVGNFDFVWKGHELGVPFTLDALFSAAYGGFFDQVLKMEQVFCEKRPLSPCTESVAALQNQGDCEPLLPPLSAGDQSMLCYAAAQGGQVAVLDFARESQIQYNKTEMFAHAAEEGQLEFIKHLMRVCSHEELVAAKANPEVCSRAALFASTGPLKTLLACGFAYDFEAFSMAVEKDNIDCLKELHSRATLENRLHELWGRSELLETAAAFGSLQCLRYAHENAPEGLYEGCEWGDAAGEAAASGDLGCLQYALSHGCPFDRERLLFIAKEYDKQKVVGFLESMCEK